MSIFVIIDAFSPAIERVLEMLKCDDTVLQEGQALQDYLDSNYRSAIAYLLSKKIPEAAIRMASMYFCAWVDELLLTLRTDPAFKQDSVTLTMLATYHSDEKPFTELKDLSEESVAFRAVLLFQYQLFELGLKGSYLFSHDMQVAENYRKGILKNVRDELQRSEVSLTPAENSTGTIKGGASCSSSDGVMSFIASGNRRRTVAWLIVILKVLVIVHLLFYFDYQSRVADLNEVVLTLGGQGR